MAPLFTFFRLAVGGCIFLAEHSVFVLYGAASVALTAFQQHRVQVR